MAVPLAGYVIVVLYSVLALIGLIGNLWVMLTVLGQLVSCCAPYYGRPSKPAGLQSSAYLYLLLLSMVDLISILPVPLLAADILSNEWPFGNVLCKLTFMCEASNKTLSPLILTALSFDRYIAVCKPTLFWMRQCRFATCLLGACLALSILFTIPIIAATSVDEMSDLEGNNHQKCAMQQISPYFDLTHTLTSYLLPLLLICAVYLAILRKLWHHTHNTTVGRRTSISLGRVVKCSVMVVAFYFICWTPYWIMRLRAVFSSDQPSEIAIDDVFPIVGSNASNSSESSFGGEGLDSPQSHNDAGIVFFYFIHSLPYAQSAFNWLFYAFLNRNLRQTSRCGTASRSTAPTTTWIDMNNPGSATYYSSLLTNIHQVGLQLRAASIDTGHLFVRHSPFKQRGSTRVRSRSSACLDVNGQHQEPLPLLYANGVANGTTNASSFNDIRRPSPDLSDGDYDLIKANGDDHYRTVPASNIYTKIILPTSTSPKIVVESSTFSSHNSAQDNMTVRSDDCSVEWL